MKTLLVALDASPSARTVLQKAVQLAQDTRASLVLFHSGDVPLLPPGSKEADWFGRAIEGEALKMLQPLMNEIPRGVDARVRAGATLAPRAIWDAAREENADMVIIGRQGFTPGPAGIGEVTLKVLESADRPVLVIS
jgi:nucleotide-binding universal stress UspA family protein